MFYYKKTNPIINDLVLAKIMAIDNLGVKIKLVEYDDKDGYMLYSNLSKRKIQQIKQTYKPNKDITVEFIEVFEGIMSFSDKNLDAKKVEEFENNTKKYHKILNLITNFLKLNPTIKSDEFMNNVLYNHLSNDDDESDNPFEIIKTYSKIVKENVMDFELEPDIKDKYLEFIKKILTDSKFKGILKYESFSPNSSGLFEIKDFYSDIDRFAKENDINIDIRLDSSPNFLIIFDDDKYNDKLKEKINKVIDYISSKKIKFSNKLVSNIITEH